MWQVVSAHVDQVLLALPWGAECPPAGCGPRLRGPPLVLWFCSFSHEVLLLLYPPDDKKGRKGWPGMSFKSTNLVAFSL